MTDARKHDTPEASEAPRRTAILDLSRSINDIIPVANVLERAQVVSDLVAEGASPSTTSPVFFGRADGPDVETYDGDEYRPVGPPEIFISPAPTAGTFTESVSALLLTIPATPYRRRLLCSGTLIGTGVTGSWDAALSVNQTAASLAQRLARFPTGSSSQSMTLAYDLDADTAGAVRLWYRLVTGPGSISLSTSDRYSNITVQAWKI